MHSDWCVGGGGSWLFIFGGRGLGYSEVGKVGGKTLLAKHPNADGGDSNKKMITYLRIVTGGNFYMCSP